MKEVVQFYAHPQIVGNEWSKAVEVQKINTPALENELEFPSFSTIQDTFLIKCRYRLKGSNETQYDEAEKDIEDMTEEVRRIVKTVYSPQAGNGVFHRTSWAWRIEDDLNASKPELIRTLRLTLFNIISKSDEVFTGLSGILTFDVSESANMDSAPGGDYIYTEAEQVSIREGTSVTEHINQDTANGIGVPKLGAGRFRGFFNARIFAKKSDIGSTAEKLDKIYILQANGQHIEAAFLQTNTNTEGTPATLSTTSYVKVTEMEQIASDVALVGFNISGRLIKPTTRAVA